MTSPAGQSDEGGKRQRLSPTGCGRVDQSVTGTPQAASIDTSGIGNGCAISKARAARRTRQSS